MATLRELCDWYKAQCNDEWEHYFGIDIETLDNPGWIVKIDLRDTILETVPYREFAIGNGDEDQSWISCKRIDMKWHGLGDPFRLEEIFDRFLQWAKDRSNWLAVPVQKTLQHRDDIELWERLGANHGETKCRQEGCNELTIRLSVFCRRHHWEHVFKRPIPNGAT